MSQTLRIAIGDVERDTREFLERHLPALGHTVVSVAQTSNELVEHCRVQRPDLVVVGVRPPWPVGLAGVAELFLARAVPVIAYVDEAGEGWAELSVGAGVFAHLFKPATEREIGPAIDAGWLRWQHFQALKREAADLKQALEDRKLVERAKGAVQRRVGVDEAEAFRRLRKVASDHNLKLVEVARRVLAAEDTFRALDAV